MAGTKFSRGVEAAGSAIIENSDGKILLVMDGKWNDKWVMPGGHIEPGETILESQVREGKEETELDLKPVAIVAWGELINSKDFNEPRHFIYFDVYCKVVSGKIKLHEALKEYRWVTPEEALKMDLGESYKETIATFIKYKRAQESPA